MYRITKKLITRDGTFHLFIEIPSLNSSIISISKIQFMDMTISLFGYVSIRIGVGWIATPEELD